MNNNVFVPFSDVSMPERPFDEIPEPIMDAMRKVNRNLNYKVRPRSIIVYGESGHSLWRKRFRENIHAEPTCLSYQ